jgi:hypothetical protein
MTLAPLPKSPFTLATWAKAKVGPDIHARVDKVLYSIPWRQTAGPLVLRARSLESGDTAVGEVPGGHPPHGFQPTCVLLPHRSAADCARRSKSSWAVSESGSRAAADMIRAFASSSIGVCFAMTERYPALCAVTQPRPADSARTR